MSTKTKRFLCKECKREWIDPRWSNQSGGCYGNSSPVSISGNPPGKNCPTCGSPEVELIEFTPPYPGLDITRDGENTVIPTELISKIPGLTGNNEENLMIVRPDLVVKNDTPLPLEESIKLESTIIQQQIERDFERGTIFDCSDMD